MSEPRVHKCLHPRALRRTQGVAVIPCGTCPECFKSKANQLAVRVFREAQYRNPFYFVTLTYSNDHVPIWRNVYDLDRSTGEVFLRSSGICEDAFYRGMFLDFAPFSWQYNKRHVRVKRFRPYVYEAGDTYSELYYSVNYEDVKKAFKSWRMAFERAHDGRKVDDVHPFKVFVVPEYGGASYRPHYHLCFLGLPSSEVYEFCRRWKVRFGYAYIERVKQSGDDSDFSRVSSYLSKYASKGPYDCPYIFIGNCKKCHRGFSKDFGIGDPVDFAKRAKYWRCEDVYPGLDFDNPGSYPVPIRPELFAERRHYKIGKYPYPFPVYFKRRLFFHRVPDYTFSNPDKWTCVEDSVGPKSVELLDGELIYSQKCVYHYVPTKQPKKPKKDGSKNDGIPTKEVATALQKLVASALLDNAIYDVFRESGLKVLPPSDFCSYRKGFAHPFLSFLDSVPSSEACSFDCPAESSAVDDLLAFVDSDARRAVSIENEFIRSLNISLI